MEPEHPKPNPVTRHPGETRLWSGAAPTQPPPPGRPPERGPDAQPGWAVRAAREREEILYPPLFGPVYGRVFPIPEDLLRTRFKQESYKPHWLQKAVLEFAPIKGRASWLYATSGLSDGLEAASSNPLTPSGLGCEFVLETSTQSPWATERLQQIMVFQLLIALGRFPNRKPLDDFDRIPLRAPIGPEPSVLTWVLLTPPTGFPRKARLQSGFFNFVEVVGISEVEAAYARAEGGEELWKLLQVYGFFPVTDPQRPSVLTGKQ